MKSTFNISFFPKFLSQKIKIFLLLALLLINSLNVFAQTTSLISACSDFTSGPSGWPYVLTATTIADGAISQGSQTFTMNVTTLPTGGANVRVYKTTANGNSFFGNAIALTLGSNSITVPAVTFDRAVKFQFSSGDVEFDALDVNGDSSDCVCSTISTSIDTVISCDSYTWIDGNTYTTSNNSASFLLMNSAGCDSTVYLNLTIKNSSSSISNISSCNIYSWNGVTYTASGIYTWTSTNSVGCDSTAVLNLTINNSSSSIINISTCDSINWNGNTYTSSGMYTWTGTNVFGCDSTAILNLTINNTSSFVSLTTCDSITWNGTTYTSSGIYTWTGTNALGCDSIVTLNLTVNNSSTSSSSISACDSYNWNGNTYTSSGTYTWSGTNIFGCDSTSILVLSITGNTTTTYLTSCDSYIWNGNTYSSSGTYTYNNGVCIDSLILTINSSSSSSSNITTCDSIYWNGTTYFSSGIYTWTGTNALGCDSIVTLNLTINNSSNSTSSISACDSYIWNGNTYTSSGTYDWQGTNDFGCDSIATLALTITTVNSTVVVVDDTTLQAQSLSPGTIYQWLDCNNNFSPVAGETNATFSTQTAGDYAVEVTLNNCSEISNCFTINGTVDINTIDKQYEIRPFPNPILNDFTISLVGIDFVDMLVLDIQGKILLEKKGVRKQDRIDFSSFNSGIYFLRVKMPNSTKQIRIIKL